MPQYDIAISSSKPAPEFTATSFMLDGPSVIQDVTPASTRRSDGDARFLQIQTESYWAQNDWAAGGGLEFPPDPTSFMSGAMDSLEPHHLRPGFAALPDFTSLPLTAPLRCLTVNEAKLYCVVGLGLYSQAVAGGAWSLDATLGAAPVHMASFRGKLWIAYSVGAQVQTYTPGVGLATITGYNADLLAPYGSMLFMLRYDATTASFRLNRYDPENPTAIPDLGVIPYGPGVQARAMFALGADLYITFQHALWRFTSANGNAGVVSGPLDSWVPAGDANAALVSGRGCAHQGGVYYSTGGGIRRYFPGGKPSQIWPLPGRRLETGAYTLLFSDFASADDRLFIGAYRYQNAGVGVPYLFCLNETGLHRIGLAAPNFTASTTITRLFLAHHPTTPGRIELGVQVTATYAAGAANGPVYAFQVSRVNGAVYSASSYTSSKLDFGMFDIDKALAEIGIAATVPAGMDVTVQVSVDGSGTTGNWVRQGTFDANNPTLIQFTPPVSVGQVLVGKVFQISLGFDLGGAGVTATTPPDIIAITAIPNPINPLRRGGRMTIVVGDAVIDHAGNRVYADAATVVTVLARLRGMRTARHPLWLTWLDGATYLARFNTLTIRRVATAAGAEPAWAVDVDWQEVS